MMQSFDSSVTASIPIFTLAAALAAPAHQPTGISEWGYHGGKPENEDDIADVGADDVTNGHIAHTVERGVDADEKLGRARSERDESKSDDERRHLAALRYGAAAFDEPLGPEIKKRKTGGAGMCPGI